MKEINDPEDFLPFQSRVLNAKWRLLTSDRDKIYRLQRILMTSYIVGLVRRWSLSGQTINDCNDIFEFRLCELTRKTQCNHEHIRIDFYLYWYFLQSETLGSPFMWTFVNENELTSASIYCKGNMSVTNKNKLKLKVSVGSFIINSTKGIESKLLQQLIEIHYMYCTTPYHAIPLPNCISQQFQNTRNKSSTGMIFGSSEPQLGTNIE